MPSQLEKIDKDRKRVMTQHESKRVQTILENKTSPIYQTLDEGRYQQEVVQAQRMSDMRYDEVTTPNESQMRPRHYAMSPMLEEP